MKETIVVDAKAPFSAFLEAQDARDDTERKQRLARTRRTCAPPRRAAGPSNAPPGQSPRPPPHSAQCRFLTRDEAGSPRMPAKVMRTDTVREQTLTPIAIVSSA
ncbi:hypothetical protein [Nocardia arthritidis]|uniref:hypothetical protein n=1 Tax=Nocardia arthritidis TaxID=228602 RepID=UPI0012EEB062|nr:hypothetical protein [Nocardia arthritidis]